MSLPLADRLRLEGLLLTLAQRGVTSDDARVPLWAAAAVCRSPADRDRFLAAFAPTDASDVGLEEPEPVQPVRRVGDPWLRRRLLVLCGLVAAALLAAALAWWLYPRPAEVTIDCSVTATCPSPPDDMVQVTRPMPVPREDVGEIRAWGLVVWLLPMVVALAWHLWLKRRRAAARARPDPEPRHAGLVEPDQTHGLMFARGREAFRRLLRHELAPGRTLDVGRTVSATLRAGGLPSFRYGHRRRTPEYLFLSERTSGSDHLRLVARLLRRRMEAEQLPVRHYEFAGTPATLHRVDRVRQGPPEPLATVLAASPSARVMLLIEAFDIDATEGTPPWLAALADAREVYHLDPRRPERWNAAERVMADAGVRSWHVGSAGLASLGTVPEAGRSGRVHASGVPDLPEALAALRRALLSTELARGVRPDAVVRDLRRAFDPHALQWLAALALYPAIVPRLTVALGERLRDGHGNPVLTEARLLEIARLPWMRAGWMPDWLRGPLARQASRATLSRALSVIQALLIERGEQRGEDAPIAVPDTDDSKARGELIEWLRACPESELHDRLLIDLLSGRSPRWLARDPIDVLPRPLRAALADRRIVEAVTVAGFVAGLVALVPPTTPTSSNTTRTVMENVTTLEPVKGEDAVADNSALADDAALTTEDAIGNQTGNGSVGVGSSAADDATVVDGSSGGEPVPAPPAPPPPAPEEPSPISTGAAPPADYVASTAYTLFFDWDKADLTAQADEVVGNAVRALASGPQPVYVRVQCWSDNEFGLYRAMASSASRCETVVDRMRGLGVTDNRISTLAWGARGERSQVAYGVRDLQMRRAEITIYRPADRPANLGGTAARGDAENTGGITTKSGGEVSEDRGLLDSVRRTLSDAKSRASARPVLDTTGTQPVRSGLSSQDDMSDKLYDMGNFTRAAAINSRTCSQGSYRGCFWNGYLHDSGKGVAKDPERALGYYRQACDLGLRQGCEQQKRLERQLGLTIPAPD